jgi:DNA-binding FrmR family transcriptional regulator
MPISVASSAVSEEDKKSLIDRLARVEGQLRGIQRMISEERECEAIAQQLAAARGALNKAFAELIACAFEHRLKEQDPKTSSARQEISQIVQLLAKYG